MDRHSPHRPRDGDPHAPIPDEGGTSPSEIAGPTPFDLVFAAQVESIYRFLYGRVGNREDAENLTSEVILTASRELDLRRSEAGITSWLFTVARTVLADHWRQHYGQRVLLLVDEIGADSLPDTAPASTANDQGERQVAKILSALPARCRQVLQLRLVDGLSVQETAQVLHTSSDDVRGLQRRALAAAVRLGPDQWPPSTALERPSS
jgi:RNA polymerase sigma-70 factor (ECF subfamily)